MSLGLVSNLAKARKEAPKRGGGSPFNNLLQLPLHPPWPLPPQLHRHPWPPSPAPRPPSPCVPSVATPQGYRSMYFLYVQGRYLVHATHACLCQVCNAPPTNDVARCRTCKYCVHAICAIRVSFRVEMMCKSCTPHSPPQGYNGTSIQSGKSVGNPWSYHVNVCMLHARSAHNPVCTKF